MDDKKVNEKEPRRFKVGSYGTCHKRDGYNKKKVVTSERRTALVGAEKR